MKKKNESRRVKYSKMVIKESLLELMKRNPINKITVTNICKAADINRGTFYLHYKDAYDLLEQIQDELFNEIRFNVEKLARSNVTSKDLLKEIFIAIANNAELCKIIFSKNGDKQFLNKILLLAKEAALKEWSSLYKNIEKNHLDYLYTYTSHGSMGIINLWLEKDLKESPEELSKLVDTITKNSTEALDKLLIAGTGGIFKQSIFKN